MANKTIKLARGLIEGRDAFRVLVVKNSTRYKPGEVLEKNEVDGLIAYGNWDVTVVELRDQTTTGKESE